MEPDTQQRRSFRQQVIVGIVIVVIGVVIWQVWPGVSLRGETAHDFGVVTFDSAPKYVEHTFSLVNVGSEPLQVKRSLSSCGCTEAVVPGAVIAPGSSIDIPVRLKLTHSGHKDASVTLFFRSGSSIDLEVQAIGEAVHTLRASPSAVRLRPPDGLGSLRLWVESNTKPAAPDIEKPEVLTVDFGGWLQTGQQDEATSTPASWTAEVKMQSLGVGPPLDSEVIFAIPGGDRLVVPINPRTYFPMPTTDDPLAPPAGDS
jgi:hypothetical protein